MEALAQQSGRAGRDGKESHSLIFYSRQDIHRAQRILSSSYRQPSDLSFDLSTIVHFFL